MNLRSHFRPVFTLLCLFLFVLCCVLGVWQLHRYHFKKELLATYQKNLTTKPEPFQQINQNADVQFQRVVVKGDYLNDLTMLLQDQFHNDQVGYDVITPVRIPGEKKLLLVDRGWVEKPQNSDLPIIAATKGHPPIMGYLKMLGEYQFILGDNILAPTQRPIVMQKIDVNELSRITNQEYFPFILRLDAQASNGYVRDWVVTTVMPERHMGYTVQWFALALVLLIAYLCSCCERVTTEKR